MPDISKVKLPSGNTYDIKDAVARDMISGGISFIIVWTATNYASTTAPSASILAAIPKGVVVQYNNGASSATGTLDASTDTKAKFYLIYSKTQAGNLDVYNEYVTVEDGSDYFWEKLGDTQIDLSNVVTDVSLSKSTDKVLGIDTTLTNSTSSVTFSGGTNDKVLGEATTFALSNGSVTHGSLTGHTDEVLGSGTTFTMTQPTINVTPSTTYIKATASGTAVGANGTASAVTGYASPSTETFVKSVSADTGNKLVTTSVPNVTSAGSASTWSFTMGTGAEAETLIIGGANSVAPTLGAAITAATGAVSSSGTGSAVVTDVTVGDSAAAITALGTPTTASVLTGVKVNTQPTITLATETASATGRVQVATGISSATATGGAVSASGDMVNAVTSMPTSSVGTGITVGTNDKVTAITGLGTATAAAQTITKGINDQVTVLTDTTDVVVTKGV